MECVRHFLNCTQLTETSSKYPISTDPTVSTSRLTSHRSQPTFTLEPFILPTRHSYRLPLHEMDHRPRRDIHRMVRDIIITRLFFTTTSLRLSDRTYPCPYRLAHG